MLQITIRIKGKLENAKLLDFMNEWKNVNVEKDGNYSIITFPLDIQATLLYETNESKLRVSITKPEEGKF